MEQLVLWKTLEVLCEWMIPACINGIHYNTIHQPAMLYVVETVTMIRSQVKRLYVT